MFYHIDEAIKIGDINLLDNQQKDELLTIVDTYYSVKQDVGCSDVLAGFPDEDDLSEPEQLIAKLRDKLINGKKAERETAVQSLIESVSEWSSRMINTTGYGISEWRKLQELFPSVPYESKAPVPEAVRVARQKMK
jgi:hypothetical protein